MTVPKPSKETIKIYFRYDLQSLILYINNMFIEVRTIVTYQNGDFITTLSTIFKTSDLRQENFTLGGRLGVQQ